MDAICNQALALGWTHENLYHDPGRTRLWVASKQGLVCFLKPGDRIGEVTTHSIEIVLPNGIRQRFYNPDVDQPWIRRVGAPRGER